VSDVKLEEFSSRTSTEVTSEMPLRSNGLPKCPRCGGRMRTYIEAENNHDGHRVIRYILRCGYCGFKNVLQEVSVRKTPQGVLISTITH
jgi:C4-type Zn-finger protein